MSNKTEATYEAQYVRDWETLQVVEVIDGGENVGDVVAEWTDIEDGVDVQVLMEMLDDAGWWVDRTGGYDAEAGPVWPVSKV